jgi:Ser/Thr protein kinase RdoA (MazF antagonist)
MEARNEAIAHGLDGRLVEPDWPPLTMDEMRGLLRFYPSLGKPVRFLSVSPRPFSAAGVVKTERAPVFVKRHHCTVRDAESLREEHRLMAHLRANGVAAPCVFATPKGETAFRIGEWTYEIHERAPGNDLYEDAISWTPFRSAEHAYAAGQALAHFHEAARGFKAMPRRNRQLVAGFTIFASLRPGEEFNRYVAGRPALGQYLRNRTCGQEALELLSPFHAELRSFLPMLMPLWTHNDWHASNLLWSDAGEDARVAGVIDFGLADQTNAVHDLAHAMERSIVDWLALINDPAHPGDVTVHYDHLFALLDGYESVRPLSREESLALAPMLGLCHAEFALSETDYFLSLLRSEEKAWYACEGYLVLHAQWFRGAGGGLLDWLREWARTRTSAVRRMAAP